MVFLEGLKGGDLWRCSLRVVGGTCILPKSTGGRAGGEAEEKGT